ncbi:MAG: hypothetical protein KAR79_05320 [Simkaniaceae bacterium]|nr:hypothetical protein [Simkaniaceae bacterium]
MTMSILYTESLSLVKTISSTSSTACSFLARTKALAIGATVVSNALEIVLTKV